jgi:hypothetical protein
VSLDSLLTEWETDSKLDLSALDEAARNVPYLHAKWWRTYTTERLRYKKLDMEFKELKRLRWEYWSGKLDDADREKHGWPVQPLKILSQNVGTYLDGDPVLQQVEKSRVLTEETLRFLEDVIKHINGRNFVIKSAIDFLKFKMGV